MEPQIVPEWFPSRETIGLALQWLGPTTFILGLIVFFGGKVLGYFPSSAAINVPETGGDDD